MAKKKASKNNTNSKKVKIGKNTILGTLAIIIIAAAIALIVVFYPSSGSGNAAVVNGKAITMEELNAQYDLVPQEYRSFITKESLLDGMINEILILDEAEKLGIVVTDADVDAFIQQALELYGMTEEDLLAVLESQGMTVEMMKESYKKKIVISRVLNKTLAGEVEVSASEARAYYDNNEDLFVSEEGTVTFEEVKVQIIDALKNEKQTAMTNAYLESLRSKADVQVFLGSESQDAGSNFEIASVSDDADQEIGSQMGPSDDSSGSQPENIEINLAECLNSKGAKLYGTGWSSNTQKQIQLLGDSFSKINYINCEETDCKAKGVTKYPTWVISGQQFVGDKTEEELYALAGC